MAGDEQKKGLSAKQRWLSLGLALAAFSLLALVIYANGGVATIFEVIARLEGRWPLLLVPYAFLALATILAYRSCLPGRGRAVPFMALAQIERSGSALNAFLPLGDSSGTLVKVALLRHWYTSDEIVAAGVWSSLATGVGNGVAAIGPLVAYSMGVLPLPYALLLSGVCLVMTLPALTIMVLVRRGIAEKVAGLVARLPLRALRGRKASIVSWAGALDAHVAGAVTHRFGDFLHVVFWRMVYQLVRVGELWLVITLLGLPGGLGAALVYNAMSRSVQQIFTFVPGRLGVVEGLAGALARVLAWPEGAGVAMALTLRFTYVVNLFIASSALSGVHALSAKYPARSAEELRAIRREEGASP